jgi:hypothetical protein
VSLAGVQLVLEAIPDEAWPVRLRRLADEQLQQPASQTSSVDWWTAEQTGMSLLEPAEAIWRTVFGFDVYPVPLDEVPDCPEALVVNDTCRMFPWHFIGERYFVRDVHGGIRGGGVNSRNVDRSWEDVHFISGSNRGEEIGLLVENVVAYWFRIVMQSLIPMLRIVDDFFLSRFLSDVTEGLVTAVLGGDRLSTDLAVKWQVVFAALRVWHSAFAFEDNLTRGSEFVEDTIDEDPVMNVVVGHSDGGLIAKALALNFGWIDGWFGVAYESPQVERSPASGFYGEVEVKHCRSTADVVIARFVLHVKVHYSVDTVTLGDRSLRLVSAPKDREQPARSLPAFFWVSFSTIAGSRTPLRPLAV